VPASLVARDRATHYCEGSTDDYESEFQFAMNSPDILRDWSSGNMNWEDVVKHAIKVIDRPPLSAAEFQEGWVNGEKRVVEVEELSEKLSEELAGSRP